MCVFNSGPPSACTGLTVDRTRKNSITVRWNRPAITGREDYYYNIHHSNPDLPGNFTKFNANPHISTSHFLKYTVSGLRPLTNYTIRVTIHNGVSDQDPGGEEKRWCEVTAISGNIRKLWLPAVRRKIIIMNIHTPRGGFSGGLGGGGGGGGALAPLPPRFDSYLIAPTISC